MKMVRTTIDDTQNNQKLGSFSSENDVAWCEKCLYVTPHDKADKCLKCQYEII